MGMRAEVEQHTPWVFVTAGVALLCCPCICPGCMGLASHNAMINTHLRGVGAIWQDSWPVAGGGWGGSRRLFRLICVVASLLIPVLHEWQRPQPTADDLQATLSQAHGSTRGSDCGLISANRLMFGNWLQHPSAACYRVAWHPMRGIPTPVSTNMSPEQQSAWAVCMQGSPPGRHQCPVE